MTRRVIFPRSIEYLLAIAEHGSYTRAAEALHVSQPTLSQQIKQLEDAVESVLVDRSKRTVRLTDAGEVYLRHARRARQELDMATRAIHDVEDLSRGSLRIGWNPITDFLACSLLERFNSEYPGICVSTREMPQDNIEVALAENQIDVGVAFSRLPSPHLGDRETETTVLFEERLCLAVGNAHHRAAQTEPISAEALGQECLVMLPGEFALRRHIDAYCREHGIQPPIAIETDSLAVLLEMVQVGSLATVLPETIVYQHCGIYGIQVVPEIPRKVISIICRNGEYKSPACRAFGALALDWAARRLKDTPVRRMRPCPLAERSCDQLREVEEASG
jgi:LysR family transcriptional regulator, cyn operon transcriptional activator